MTGTETAQPNQIPSDVGLTADEAARVRELLDREPNELEWAMFGAMWSEHCAYKHSKKLLRTLPTSGPAVAVGPGENAGAVDLGGGLLYVFKVESHNHPSAIEPFQGAATGVGGILRDVFAMGARPTAVLNALFFGPPDDSAVRRTLAGVTGGISFYGNCVGIPDVAGHISFEPCYADNPLVNAMCVGFARSEDLRKASGARPGSAVYLVGSDTGRDGIAGASLLASFELGTGSDAKRPSVQVGNPFLEKLLLEATLELVDADAIEAVQDLGAAGLTCAVSEVAAKSRVGMRIDVALVPRRARAMTPYEVMLSESQERMLVIARPGRERDVERIFKRWELHGTRIGEVTAEPLLQIFDADQLVASLPPRALADDAPEYDIADLAASHAAEAEASRNLVCMGATPLAITDCVNVGNPERPQGAWQLTRTVEGIAAASEALGVPVVSGNVSLYNATHGADIWPAAVIGAVGRFADVTNYIPPTSGKPGDLVLLAGSAQVSLGASAYGATRGIHEGPVTIDLEVEARLKRFILAAHAKGAIRAAHDRDAGGLAVALTELVIRDRIGMKVTLPAIRGIDKRVALFGEGSSGVVLVIEPAREDGVRALAREHDIPLWTLGTVGGDLLEVAPVLGTPVAALAEAHAHGLGQALGRDA